jgi:uncharacterized protein (TIGR00369 family)
MDESSPSDRGDPPDDRPFLALFRRMLTERDGWPGAACDERLGMRYTEIDEGRAVAEWEATEAAVIPTGTIHGGHIAAVADSVCSMAALTTLERRGMTAGTLSLSVDFYRYARPETLTFAAQVSHRGRHHIFVTCDIVDARERRVASARATLHANEPKPSQREKTADGR